MRYKFVLSRSHLVTLISGLALLGLLIFTGGLLSGVYWQLRNAGSPTGTSVADPAPRALSPDDESPPEGASAEPQAAYAAIDKTPVREEPVREEPAPQEPTRPEAPEQAGKLVYELQIGLFRVNANAVRLVEKLRGRGYEPVVVESRSSAGVLYHSVRIGAYRSLEEAKAAQAEYAEAEGEPTVIRRREVGE